MAELSISETTTFRWSFEEDVLGYSVAGIPAIGVWRHKLSDCGPAKARDLIQRNGLKASHLFWAGGFTGGDGCSCRESIEDAREAIRAAAALKCPTLIVYSGSRAGHTFNHARRLAKAALAELAPFAAEQDVTLAIEPMHPGCAGEWTFLHTIDDVMELLESVSHPRLKMVLDTYHLGLDGGLAERIPQIASSIALVQLGDARRPPEHEQNRCRLGAGIVPLGEIVAALKKCGYDGFYDVELFGEEFETEDYCALLEHAKEAFRELVDRL
ncbi:MAG: sugar phosphate isomerase/epimerase [Pirellulaceae bacterium]|nr:sugar phosphate isomerase/epimerase [Pirellulaceae bacterium]